MGKTIKAMNYLDYLKEGKNIPETSISTVKDVKGNETNGWILRSPEGLILAKIAEWVLKQKLINDRLKEINPKNNKNTTNNSSNDAKLAIAAKFAGYRGPGVRNDFNIVSDLANNPF